jgi:hypothetical protein
MNTKLHFHISASLPQKTVPLSAVAEKTAALLRSLREIHPFVSEWFESTGPKTGIALTPNISVLEQTIYAQSCFDGASRPDPALGYYLGACNRRAASGFEPPGMSILMNAGGPVPSRIWFQTTIGGVPDPALVAYTTFKKILFAIADAFDPLFSSAYPAALDRDLMIPEGKKRPIFAGWMVLLPRELACQITPPRQAIQQTREDGSLFMAATDETFDVKNATHLAVSKAIQEAIEPINKW